MMLTEIPKTLSIKLTTHIPGYQNINYLPSMTIPDEKSGIVRFNPLIKLNKSIIKNSPPSYIQKQFFEKPLFVTLNNKILSSSYYGEKKATLEEATKNGYISNNIQLTIDTLFPKNSVINIGGQDYTIYDVIFDNKTWSMQPKEVIEESLRPQNWLKNRLIQQQILKGNNELEKIPKDIKEGPKYAYVKTIPDINTFHDNKNPLLESKQDANNNFKTPPREKKITSEPPVIERKKLINKDGKQGCPPNLPKFPNLTLPFPSYVKIPKNDNSWTQQQIKNDENLKKFRAYFGSIKYFNILNTMQQQSLNKEKYGNMFTLNKEYIQNQAGGKTRKLTEGVTTRSQKKIPSSDHENRLVIFDPPPTKKHKSTKKKVVRPNTTGRLVFNYANYKKLINKLQVINVPGDGDCMFSSIAEGINMHNNANPTNQITLRIDNDNKAQCYKGTEFNSTIIRFSVWYYLNNNPDEIIRLQDFARNSINILNTEYDKFIDAKKVIEESKSKQIINTIFNNSGHTLFIKIDYEAKQPFKLIEGQEEIYNHLMDKNFWGEQSIIPIIEKVFSMKLVIIKEENSKYQLGGFSIDFTMNKDINKGMFLRLINNNHYDLIVFSDPTKTNQRNKKVIYDFQPNENIKYFDNISNNPPIYILLFLYGNSNYYQLSQNLNSKEIANKFYIFAPLFQIFTDMIDNIINSDDTSTNISFVKKYNTFFPPLEEWIPGKSETKGGNNNSNIEKCVICREPTSDSCVKTNCGHTFDKECLKKWCKEKKECPICKRNISDTCEKIESDATSSMQKTPKTLFTNTPNKPYSNLMYSNPIYGNPAYRNPMYRNPMYPNPMYTPPISMPNDNLTYKITLHLILEPGKNIPLYKKPGLSCKIKWNQIKKDWAEVTNTQYAPAPYLPYPKLIAPNTSKKNTKGGKRKKTRKNKTI